MNKDLICRFTEILSQLRVLHWQTCSFARHKAYEDIYNSLGDLIDDFVEVYQGKYKRIKITSQPKIFNIDEDDCINKFIDENLNFLIKELPQLLKSVEDGDDVDLFAIRDEMVRDFNKLRYLLTLK